MFNTWNVSFGSIKFFEEALNSHNKVLSVKREKDILFNVTRVTSPTELVIVLINQYTISLADVIKLKNEFPSINCIVTAGDWNGYTEEAKKYGLEQNIGVFVISEILGALNFEEYVNYVKYDSDGNPWYSYKSA